MEAIIEAKKMTSETLHAGLNLLMGSLQAGRAYPGAISSFSRAITGFGKAKQLRNVKDIMIDLEGFNKDWKQEVVNARNLFRSKYGQATAVGTKNKPEGEYVEPDFSFAEYLKEAEDMAGHKLTDAEVAELQGYYNQQ